jgi:hypothetical protein
MNVNVKDFIYDLGKSSAYKALIPLGFTAGYPVYSIDGERLFIKIPFYRTERIIKDGKQTGKSFVFPIRYLLSYSFDDGKLVKFEDFLYDKRFSKVDFGKPIGEHFTIHADKTREQMAADSKKLMELYDKMAKAITEGTKWTDDDDAQFAKLFTEFINPALAPIYQAIEPAFMKKYLQR